MTFIRPTLREIVERTEADAQSRLTVAQLRRSNSRVYTRVLSGAVHGLFGYAQYISQQLFFDTAEGEYLDRWAFIYGLTRKAAERATGSVTFSYSGDLVDIPVGTTLQSDDGVVYATTSGVTLVAGASPVQANASVQASVPGASGNQTAGDVLSLISPIAGVVSEVSIVALSGGADEETDESLRVRLLARTQETGHGGAASDYVQWCLAVPGVTRAWCYPREEGEGTVTVRFVCDGIDPIIPDESMLDRVAAYLETVRPVTTDVYVRPPVTQAVDLTIAGVTPSTAAVKEAIIAEVKNLFTREAIPGGGIYLSHIRAAVSAAAGEEDHTVVSPVTDPEAETANSLLVQATITWH